MEVMIDLHATDIDEPRTALARFFEQTQSIIQIGGEKRWALDIERVGMQ